MLDYEQSLLMHQNTKIIALLEDIKAQGVPVTTVEQAEKTLSAREFRELQVAAVKDHSFGELLEALALNRGFENVFAMHEYDSKKARSRAKRGGISIDFVNGVVDLRPKYQQAEQVMTSAFLKHLGKDGVGKQ